MLRIQPTAPKKKIMVVANSTWNIYNFRLNLIRKLKTLNYEVIIVAPIDEYIQYLSQIPGTRHIPLKQLSPQSSNPLRDIALVIELIRIYRRENPDLILHYTIKPNIYGSMAAFVARKKCICTVTGLGYPFLNDSLVNDVVQPLYSMAFRHAQKVVFHNRDDRALFLKKRLVTPEKAIVIPGSGVNTNHFRPILSRKRKQSFNFLFIGRLLYDKGIREYVEAAKSISKRYPKVKFTVIGELDAKNPSAISKETLLKWVEENKIIYKGVVNDVRSYIKESDVVVLPSYREGLPRVILEAMSMAKPVITTDTAGCRSTVQDGKTGFIIPPKNSSALAVAMAKMIDSPSETLGEMGMMGRARVLRIFDEKIIISLYINQINQILGSDIDESDKEIASA